MSSVKMSKNQYLENTHRAHAKIGTGLALVALAATALPAAAQQSETSAACDEGVIAEPVALAYGDATDGCDIGPATGDTDRFVFTAAAGDLIRLRLLTLSNDLDPDVEIRDAQNMPVDSASCDANVVSRCSTALTVPVPGAGDYLVIVSDTGSDNTGGYVLQLERIQPPPVAVAVPHDATIEDVIDPGTDTDFFAFEATAGTTLRLNAIGLANDLDLRAQLFAPDGSLVLDGLADGAGCDANVVSRCSFAVGFTPGQDGAYSLQIVDNDAFNTGGYRLSLWCEFGACPGAPTPDPDGPAFNYVVATEDAIETNTDGDFYTFHATAGALLAVRGVTLSNDLDPRVVVRDPTGAIVLDGLPDGAGCDANVVSRCAFGFALTPAMSGTYTMQIYDDDAFNTGGYRISHLCVLGDCDSDADGLPDRDRQPLFYGVAVTPNAIGASTEGDFYEFQGTDGDEVRITVTGQSNDFDPRIQIRDPAGTLIVDGIADGAGCDANVVSTCVVSLTLFPAVTGVHSLVLYDDDGFNPGNYDIVLECIFGTGPGFTCDDIALPPVLCADNCSLAPNADQRDTDADGFGNLCDTDLDNDGQTNVVDLGLMRNVFFTSDPDADFNGDGVVNAQDLGIMKARFFTSPGPSCVAPNAP